MSYNNDYEKFFTFGVKLIDISKDPGVANAASSAINGVVNSVGNTATSVVGAIDNFFQKRQQVKLEKLKIQLRQMEIAHQEKMQSIQNEHNWKMLEERNRHDEVMFKQQCEIIKLAIETAEKVFNKKMDFYQAQLDCLEDVYSRESNLLTEHITFLEKERTERINDANQYALISSDINKLEDKRSELYNAYLKSQGSLQDAIKYLEIEKSFNNAISGMNKGLIERKE